MSEHQHNEFNEHNPEREAEVREQREADADPNLYRDAGDARDPNENNLPDEVLIDNAGKIAHEDLPVRSEKELEESETRAGDDLEASKTARELHDERRAEREKSE